MRFQIGKTYRHTSGRIMTIVGLAQTRAHGIGLIAEEPDGRLITVGWDSDDYALNWEEIAEPPEGG